MSCRLQRTAGRSRLSLAQGLPGMGHVNLRLLGGPSVQTGSAKAEYPGEHSSGRVLTAAAAVLLECKKIHCGSIPYLVAAILMQSQLASSPIKAAPSAADYLSRGRQGWLGLGTFMGVPSMAAALCSSSQLVLPASRVSLCRRLH